MSATDMTPLGTYCLTPRTTKTGKAYITRSEWEDWFGDLVATNERRVSTWFPDREAAIPFCNRYANENPGCRIARDARRGVSR